MNDFVTFAHMLNIQVYPEGTHIMIPWFERPVIYDVRARPHLVESTSGSRDLQMVILTLFLCVCVAISKSVLICIWGFFFLKFQYIFIGIK